MPQFDFNSFITQTFWILLVLSSFYFFVVYQYLPKYSSILKFRTKLVSFFTTFIEDTNVQVNFIFKNIVKSLK